MFCILVGFIISYEITSFTKSSKCNLFVYDIVDFKEGYNTLLGERGVTVSGGQKQRLCIARALLKNPKVLIFDDSTSAVDTKTDALIRQSLRAEAPDTTKIIIAAIFVIISTIPPPFSTNPEVIGTISSGIHIMT